MPPHKHPSSPTPETRELFLKENLAAEGGERKFLKLILPVLGCQHHQHDWSNAMAFELLSDTVSSFEGLALAPCVRRPLLLLGHPGESAHFKTLNQMKF